MTIDTDPNQDEQAAADEPATSPDTPVDDAAVSEASTDGDETLSQDNADEREAEDDGGGGASGSVDLLGRDQMTRAEREYQAALRAAEALGLGAEPTAHATDETDQEAGELAARLGLDQAAPAEPETPDTSFFDEPEAEEETEPDEAEEEDAALFDPGDGRNWYVLNTYSGHETRVEKNLDRRIKSMDVADKIFRIIVPTEEELEIRGGQRRQVQHKLLPGYVLVEMILDDDTWYVVRNTPGVTGFVGTEHPVPLPVHEVKAILKQMKSGSAEPRIRVGFGIGDTVRVMEGPFDEFMGEVDEINLEKGKVRVLISMFGRETPVELDFIQVEKV